MRIPTTKSKLIKLSGTLCNLIKIVRKEKARRRLEPLRRILMKIKINNKLNSNNSNK